MNFIKVIKIIAKITILITCIYFLNIAISSINRDNNITNNIVNIPVTSGSVNIVTKDQYNNDLKNITSDVDKYNYIIKNGIPGEDYIVNEPNRQPNLVGQTNDINNPIMWDYMSNYRSQFTLPKSKKNGYIVFIAAKVVVPNKNLFLGINGKSLGILRKEKAIMGYDDKMYIFDIKSLPIAQINKGVNLYDYSIGENVQLSPFVEEKDNYIERIVIAFY